MARKSKEQVAKVESTSEAVRASATRPQQPEPPQRKAKSILLSASTSKAFSLILLAGIYSPLSQLILSPVYGSIPSAMYHKYGTIGSAVLAFALRGILPTWVERGLPAFAFWIPSLQLLSSNFSSKLGVPLGPLVTELGTLFPLITWSLFVAGKVFDDVDLSFLNSNAMEESVPSMVFYMLFTFIERLFREVLPQLLAGVGFLRSRIGIQLAIGTLYGLLLPKSLFWPAIPSIIITMTLNVHNPLHRTTEVLNNTLALHNYKLLSRFESVTGYLSVFEDNQKQFRAMRCDHSLLGGQWLDPPNQAVERKVAEPIYAVFTMMEAVRLVEPPKSQAIQSFPKQALNIGLGIGTAPAALIMHGVNTTVVELDPIVHYLAGTYFNFPRNHTFYLGDAVGYVEHFVQEPSPDAQYDYILHDAFTGGAVPTSLFTYEFLSGLSTLLKPDGTIAINYAGDLNLRSASMVYATIASVFPNCRIFREEPESAAGWEDFTNVVFFCTHPSNKQPIKFRKPVKADYLGSGARQQFLVPKHEVDVVSKFGIGAVVRRSDMQSIKELERWQTQSAIGHWRLMRRVIPDIVWENW